MTEVLKDDMLWIWLTPPFFVLVLVDWEVGVEDEGVERACSWRSFSWWNRTYSAKFETPILTDYLVARMIARGLLIVSLVMEVVAVWY